VNLAVGYSLLTVFEHIKPPISVIIVLYVIFGHISKYFADICQKGLMKQFYDTMLCQASAELQQHWMGDYL
jgi:hypothetical protein